MKVKVAARQIGLGSLGLFAAGRPDSGLPKPGIGSIRNWQKLAGSGEITRFVRDFPNCGKTSATVRVFIVICGDRMCEFLLASLSF